LLDGQGGGEDLDTILMGLAGTNASPTEDSGQS
jgi:hypothetical protein